MTYLPKGQVPYGSNTYVTVTRNCHISFCSFVVVPWQLLKNESRGGMISCGDFQTYETFRNQIDRISDIRVITPIEGSSKPGLK